MAPRASVSVPDQFEVYNELVRRSRRSFLLSAVLMLTTMLAMALAFMSFTRPLPVVVVSDNPLEPRKIVGAGDAQVREIDAKRFMASMAKRLHGWSSTSAVAELTDASFLMTGRWRKRFLAEMNADVTVPETIDKSGKTTMLQTYVLSGIKNELIFDWDSAVCAKETAPEASAWSCRAEAVMKIEPLLGDPLDDPRLTKHIAIRATFVEVKVTEATVDGLLVDFWDAQLTS